MRYIQLLALLFVSVCGYAQPGTLDNDFDADGIVVLDFLGGIEFAEDMQIQPDGKIVFCGNAFAPGESFVYASRINPDGSLDNAFGDNGVAQAISGDEGNALAIQADGKIVVGGRAGSDFLYRSV
ncbi:hypothetical protein N9J52_01885 [Flavobacteriales bacterium]|nr:hypothetical protein [Flavobacteriales bacterium]